MMSNMTSYLLYIYKFTWNPRQPPHHIQKAFTARSHLTQQAAKLESLHLFIFVEFPQILWELFAMSNLQLTFKKIVFTSIQTWRVRRREGGESALHVALSPLTIRAMFLVLEERRISLRLQFII